MNMLLTTSAFIFPLVTFPYITRVLLPEGNGKIAFANSVINYFPCLPCWVYLLMEYGPVHRCGMTESNYQKTAHEIWMINGIMTVIAYAVLGGCNVGRAAIPRRKYTAFSM